jgi:acyl dehydratase
MTSTSETPSGVEAIHALLGQESGPTEWYDVTQERIDAFADATGDHQWIHVDPERAAQSPLGKTIAHGLFTLSLGPKFSGELKAIGGEGFVMALNYGYDKVRFMAPVPVGSRLRMRSKISDVKDVAGGVQVTTVSTFEIEGQEKPVCVAESLVRMYTAPAS